MAAILLCARAPLEAGIGMSSPTDARTTAASGLARLLAPLTPQQFEQEYADQRPLHINRGDPEYFADLLTFDDVDRLLTLSGPNFENVRVASNGVDAIISSPDSRRHEAANRLETIYRHYRAGSTIVLNSVNERHEPLKQLERALNAELGAGLEMNVYLTPGGQAQGFRPHYDTHDVLVLQIHGTKHWGIYGSPFPQPLPMPAHEFNTMKAHLPAPGAPDLELEMEPGDILYLPRGTMHAATSNETATIHLTIGIHRQLWFPLIQVALVDMCARDPRIRAALPIGFSRSPEATAAAAQHLRELLGILAGEVRAEQFVGVAAGRTAFTASPSLRGHLRDLEDVDEITGSSPIFRRPGIRYNLGVVGSSIRLEFHNKILELPTTLAHTVAFLLNGDEKAFTAADLPAELDEAGRLNLVKRLIREGYLTLSAPAAQQPTD
jgi:ribosomal protein L16 Arg81 hydroxylase